jgi:hypothetical protein
MPTYRRTLWHVSGLEAEHIDDGIVYDNYGLATELWYPNYALANAVGSLLEYPLTEPKTGLHAPALDIDWPARLRRTKECSYALTVPVEFWPGDIPASSPTDDIPMDIFWDAWDDNLSHVIETACEVGFADRGSWKWLSGQGYQIKLIIPHPTYLVGSRRRGHFHLYVDQVMPWQDYLALILALEKIHVIEYGFRLLAENHQCTHLRRQLGLEHDVEIIRVPD